MADVTREEVSARLETAEVRVAAAVEAMRADNDRFHHQMDRLTLSLEHSSATLQLEFVALKSEVLQVTKDATFQMSEEMHKLRSWVLTGALTGMIALLGFVITTFVRIPGEAFAPSNSPSKVSSTSSATR